MNQRKGPWCPNAPNPIRNPTRAEWKRARRVEHLTVNRVQLREGLDDGAIPTGLKRPRLTCAVCRRRFIAQTIYDHGDHDLIGFKVPDHRTQIKRVTRKKWTGRNPKH